MAQLVAVITFTIMFSGVMANLMVYLTSRKMGSMNSSFGMITKNQAICNIVLCLIYVILVCPMQLSHTPNALIEHSHFLGLTVMTIYEISNQLHLILALNRLCAVFWTFHYDRIFTKFNTNVFKNLAILLAVSFCLLFYEHLGCNFSYSNLSWTFVFLNTEKCSKITWYSDFIFNTTMVGMTLFFNSLTAWKVGKDSRNLLSSVGVRISKEQKQREKSFIKQSLFQGASIFAGQVTYYVTAPLVSNYSILLFLDASLWAFMHAFEGEAARIAILVVISNGTDLNEYKIALDSVQCYARIQGYEFLVVRDPGPKYECMQKDFLFRRHCITASVLQNQNHDAVMFLDADIGVVNPLRQIQEFLEDVNADIFLFDRFQNWEVATGSYLVRNAQFAVDFLNEFANYESRLPNNSFHGADNGAIHIFLAEKLLPPEVLESSKCTKLFENSKSFNDLFIFEACIRRLLDSESSSKFSKVRILQKGKSWVRDAWITNSQWSPDIDFMLHGWKMSQLRGTPVWELKPFPSSRNQWFSPFSENFYLEKCSKKNFTWSYDHRLIGMTERIRRSLIKMADDVEVMQKKALAKNEEDE